LQGHSSRNTQINRTIGLFLVERAGRNCGSVGGDRLHASLPQVPLIAAGGVNQRTAASFLLSGATAIGVGTELIPTEAIQRRQSQRIHELAHRFAKLGKDAREQLEAWERS
jgi:2-keto-3-deoxy-6-phosphogluconate aldolase